MQPADTFIIHAIGDCKLLSKRGSAAPGAFFTTAFFEPVTDVQCDRELLRRNDRRQLKATERP